MRIAIGLPSGATGGPAGAILEWARRAEAGPFSSVAVLDRGVSPGLEPLAVLAAAGAVTRRVRLMASIVIGPTRETTLLARQAAAIDALSDGRLSLGLAIGLREADYRATGFDFHARGRRLDEQLPTLRRLWSGGPLSDEIGPVGSAPARPGGPELLIGGYLPVVARRIAAWGDGFMAPGGGRPADMAALWERILEAWREAGREGAPRWVGAGYYALGPGADDAAGTYIRAMYGHDPELAARRLRAIPTSPAAVREFVAGQAALGADELILRPVAPELDQLERLADLVG